MNEEQLEQQLQNLPRFRVNRKAVAKFYIVLMVRVISVHVTEAFRRKNFLFAKFAAGAAFALVITAGVGTYAYASPSVTRGDALYPVKTSIEHARLSLSPTPLGRVRAYSTQALHRLGEAETLSHEGYGATHKLLGFLPVPVAYAESESDEAQDDEDDPLAQTIREMIESMRSALTESETIADPKKLEKALRVVGESQMKQSTRLRDIAKTVGPDVKEAVMNVVAEALDETDKNRILVERAAKKVADARASGKKEARAAFLDREDTTQPIIDQTAIDDAKQAMAHLREKLSGADVSEENFVKLTLRLETKLEKAQVALESGNPTQAAGLLKSADALANNAKHFFTQTKDNTSGKTRNRKTATSTGNARESKNKADDVNEAKDTDKVDGDEKEAAEEENKRENDGKSEIEREKRERNSQ